MEAAFPSTPNLFRAAEKRYKAYQGRVTDTRDVFDFRNLDANSPDNRSKIISISADSSLNVFSITGYEDGFRVILNPFSPEEQLEWSLRCLTRYVLPPNLSNLNPFHGPVGARIAQLFSPPPSLAPPASPVNAATSSATPMNDTSTPAISRETSQRSSPSLSPSVSDTSSVTSSPGASLSKPATPPATQLLQKLRWVTLGYQYDWTRRVYTKEMFVAFPEDLAALVADLAKRCGFSITAEAAIINFYATDSVLCGHLDDAEFYYDAPIVSMSFGNSAIFLLGGETKDIAPVAVLVRSGDVVLMGGRSRRCYHGVPRIFAWTLPPELQPQNVPEKYKKVAEYLTRSRININVRQVLAPGAQFPEVRADDPPPMKKQKAAW